MSDLSIEDIIEKLIKETIEEEGQEIPDRGEVEQMVEEMITTELDQRLEDMVIQIIKERLTFEVSVTE